MAMVDDPAGWRAGAWDVPRQPWVVLGATGCFRPIATVDDLSCPPSSTPVVKWREHAFLDNPRCPETVKKSKLTIYTSTKYKTLAEKYIVQDGGTALLLPSTLSTDELQEALKPYEKFKVCRYVSPATLKL